MPDQPLDSYLRFDRDAWSALRANTPLTLNEADLDTLRGINDKLSLEEVERSYLPLSRLLNLHVAASVALRRVTATFVGRPHLAVPYVIGIAGSVAVGKSTTARVLAALLSRWPDHPVVNLVTTDGFLLPNRELEARGLMQRKGFPESYDVKALVGFLVAVKSGQPASAPVYSHLSYDVTDEIIEVAGPDILIVEGINVLQTAPQSPGASRPFVSDFFDFSIYVDAEEQLIHRWFLERFDTLRETAFRDPASYFHRYAAMDTSAARAFAEQVWATINAVNLRENIEPTRARASLILEKGEHHEIRGVALRRL